MPNPTIKPDTACCGASGSDLRGDESALFGAWASKLRRSVARNVNTSDTVVDDACSFAWMQLVRCQPRRETAFPWLVKVATREAWRLDRAERASWSRGTDVTEAVDPHDELASRELLRDAAELIGRLHPRRRQMLIEHASGLTFDEIGERHGISRTRACALVYRARRQLAGMRDEQDA